MKAKLKRGDLLRITYHQPNGDVIRPTIRVLAAIDADVVGVDPKTGKWYATSWDAPKGTTTGQRAKHHFRINQRHWHCWPRGLFSFAHGMDLALRRSDDVYIPHYEELLTACQTVGVELELLEGDILEQFAKLDDQLTNIAARLNGRSREMTEAKEKIELCVLVKRAAPINGFQLCILKARLNAVNTRLFERLANITGWQPKYAARARLAIQGQKAAARLLDECNRDVTRLIASQLFTQSNKGRNAETEIGLVRALTQKLSRWSWIEPFVAWTAFCLADCNQIIEHLKASELSELNDAHDRLKALANSIKFKGLQSKLEKLILELERDISLSQVKDSLHYVSQLRNWLHELSLIDEHNWRQPLKNLLQADGAAVVSYLRSLAYPRASAMLKIMSGKM